jgi:hypothetical protein
MLSPSITPSISPPGLTKPVTQPKFTLPSTISPSVLSKQSTIPPLKFITPGGTVVSPSLISKINIPTPSSKLSVKPINIVSPTQLSTIPDKSSYPYPVNTNKTFTLNKKIDVLSAKNSSIRSLMSSSDPEDRETGLTKLERSIILNQGKCADDVINNLRLGTFQLDAKSISEYLDSDGRYDSKVQDGMGCLVDALISTNDKIPNVRLKRWITDIHKIGGDTAEGKAFKLESNSNELFVIKVPADPEIDSLPHEAIVGMGALNIIRNFVPNFMDTYGAFMCSPPILDDMDEVKSWCQSKNNPVTYLVLENIQNAVPLSELCSTITGEEFLEIYVQILNALHLAYSNFDYTHYDLHADNVLVQVLPYYVSIPFYSPTGKILYIKTKYLARIIDYGMSHVFLGTVHFGNYGLEHVNVFAERSFPMHDVYKLLFFCFYFSLRENIKNNNPLSSKLSAVVNKIYDFFGEGITAEQRVINRLQDAWSDYFQPDTKYINLTYNHIMTYIISNINLPFIFVDRPIDSILTVCDDNCVTWDGFNQHMFNRYKLPQTLVEYCQAVTAISKLSTDDNQKELYEWLSQVDVRKLFDTEKITALKQLHDIKQELSLITILPYSNRNFVIDEYEKSLFELVNILSDISNVELWISSVFCVFNRISDTQYINKDISEIKTRTSAVRSDFLDKLRQVKTNNIKSASLNEEPIGSLHNILSQVV